VLPTHLKPDSRSGQKPEISLNRVPDILLRGQISWRQRWEDEEQRTLRERRHDRVAGARTLTARILGP
jgi:hypothetical protein